MALIYIEGFDAVDVAAMITKGWQGLSSSFAGTGTSYSRWLTGRGLRMTNQLGWGIYYFYKDRQNDMYVGMAMKQASAGSPWPGSGEGLITFRDDTGNHHILAYIMGDYSIGIYRYVDGLNDVLIAQSAVGVVPADYSWFHIEMWAKIHDTAGAVIVRINENEVINATGLDTKRTGATDYIGAIMLQSIRNDIDTYFDDFYIDNAQFHGNCRIRTFMPDSDGTYSDFTRSGGSNDYECVDEIPPNEDTDYIYTLTKGHKSSFGITTGAFTGTIKAMQMHHAMKNAGSGVRRMRPFVRSGGADYEGPPSAVIPPGAYAYRGKHILTADPQDSNPWTQAKLEAAEFGLRLVHGTTTTSTTTSTTTTVP